MPMVDARRESRHISLSSGRDPRGCRTARNGFILPNGTPSSTEGRGEVFPRTVQNVGVEGQDETREHKQFGIRCGRGSVCGSFGKSCQCYSYMLLSLTACVACTPAYEMLQGHEAWTGTDIHHER